MNNIRLIPRADLRQFTRGYAFKSDLKIKWVRPEKIPSYKPAKSGDLKPMPDRPKNEYLLEFQQSKELETANDYVKRLFTLEFNSRQYLKKSYQTETINKIKRHEHDETSREAKLAQWTAQIRAWQPIMDENPADKQLKVILKELIEHRKKYLKFLRQIDYKRFEWILEELDIVYKSPPSEFHWITRKDSLRKLTDIHCANIRQTRLDTLRKEYEDEQPKFLEEKIRTLEFIRDEQKDCGVEVTVKEEEIEAVRKQLEELKKSRVVVEEY